MLIKENHQFAKISANDIFLLMHFLFSESLQLSDNHFIIMNNTEYRHLYPLFE